MAPRIGRIGLALAVLAAVFAVGCTADEPASSAISALQASETAKASASQWQADAELVALSGIEAHEDAAAARGDPEGNNRPGLRSADASVGDGRAPAWTALFYSETANGTRSYLVTEAGAEDQGPAEAPSSRPRPLANWSVDSPDAVGTAMSNASFREAALAGDSSVVQTLGMREEGPVWELTAHDPSNGNHVQLLVDAVSGALIGSDAS